jgi:RimJ/RimL family protein N-acetyltransferase
VPNAARIGGMAKSELLRALRERGVQFNQAAEDLFDDRRFMTLGGAQVVEIASVSVAKLGYREGAIYAQVVARARESGLFECPVELGPHLRLQFPDQPDVVDGPSMTHGRAPPGSITVASTPLDEADETPKGFYLRRTDGVSWLRGYRSSADHVWSPEDVLVFSRRRVTRDVSLRPVLPVDLELLFQQFRDPDAVRMAAFTAKDPSDRAAFDAHWTKLVALPTVRARAVVADGVVVGSITAFDADLGREVTYWIDRAQWGRGLATAALAALLAEETTRPLFARASKDNAGSIRVLEKCGFRVVGADRFFANARGAEIDEVVLRLDA